MIKLSQYESMLSLYLTIIGILPCVVLCFFGKKCKILNLVVNILFILSFLGIHSIQFIEFLVFVIFETILIYAFKAFRKRCSSELVYYAVFAASMSPILGVRMTVFRPDVAFLIGFTGISYMCFKIWQIIFDIHDGKIETLKIVDLWLYMLFFPSFASGPIARYQDFMASFERMERTEYINGYFTTGLKKVLLGVFYKFAMAFFISTYIMNKIPENATVINIVAYMYAYTLYLFFDFAGYSNIAIGMGYLMGVKLPENFNKPFLACNMKEFWNRWHMSLSSWFNDYVFGRFVLNNMRNGLFKNTKVASRWASLFTMTVMGLWHGFSIHYVAYGVYEGVLLVITDFWVKSKVFRKFKKKKYYNVVCRVICFQFIAFGMLLFSGKYFFE